MLADLFLGLGAARRKRPDPVPNGQHHEIWERLLGLLEDFQPKRVVLLGDIKPNQGHLEDDEAEELRALFQKLRGHGREVIQVVGHPERAWGPSLENTGIQPMDSYRVGANTLMHRRRIFVYPRHDPPTGFWINGGLHPLFALPLAGPDSGEGLDPLPRLPVHRLRHGDALLRLLRPGLGGHAAGAPAQAGPGLEGGGGLPHLAHLPGRPAQSARFPAPGGAPPGQEPAQGGRRLIRACGGGS